MRAPASLLDDYGSRALISDRFWPRSTARRAREAFGFIRNWRTGACGGTSSLLSSSPLRASCGSTAGCGTAWTTGDRAGYSTSATVRSVGESCSPGTETSERRNSRSLRRLPDIGPRDITVFSIVWHQAIKAYFYFCCDGNYHGIGF